MKLSFSKPFTKDYHNLPEQIQHKLDKQLEFLLKDFRHPSLRIKKIKGTNDKIWEGSVTMNYRFTFQIIDDIFLMRRVGKHEDIF